MNDTQLHKDCPSLTIAQIRDLVAFVRDSFEVNLSRTRFIDRLLMLLEDVPGYETDDVPATLIESVWVMYSDRPPGP
ncbi:hypothetical protein BTHA_1282 [Burkholderia thailandensis MSMB59]|uniref:hypothetical protein n=1 Tax=Burkholderia thailandensis TaxID=57975 RepID=UPI000515524B|nr:hypothetical protein [Burkholderia thailandensis]AIS95519.1 hypothetical protein BTHA_1282 [Burkholderia thailandensis MSMB59]AOJ46117.1 hypothetical protein WJ27_14120 [Burkholderia thailandensis]KVG21319.1 hypothetical protein WJ28_24635 [Burkholderia thailandensis]